MDAGSASADAEVVVALDAALSPYRWRRFTAELLARVALAARDRQQLTAVLAEVEGATVGRRGSHDTRLSSVMRPVTRGRRPTAGTWPGGLRPRCR